MREPGIELRTDIGPCPFCGSLGAVLQIQPGARGYIYAGARVVCDECRASGPSTMGGDEAITERTKARAVGLWNQRVRSQGEVSASSFSDTDGGAPAQDADHEIARAESATTEGESGHA